MKTKSERALNTVFFVKNDKDGQALIKQMKAHLNVGWQLILRGRNENRRQFGGTWEEVKAGKKSSRYNLQSGLRRDQSSYFAIYLKNETIDNKQAERYRENWAERDKQRHEIEKLNIQLNQSLPSLAEKASALTKQVQALTFAIINLKKASWASLWLMLKALILRREWWT
jgi:hypothetical protein